MALDYVVDHLGRSRRPAGLAARRISPDHHRDPRAAAAVPHRGADPGFQGRRGARCAPCSTPRPDVLNHNIETVPRLYRTARPGGRYERALAAARPLAHASRPASRPSPGLMVGLGEEMDEVVATLGDLRDGRLPDRHDRPVPAPVAREPADVALLHAGRVRRAEATSASSWASATSSPARSCAVPITRTNRRRRSRRRLTGPECTVHRFRVRRSRSGHRSGLVRLMRSRSVAEPATLKRTA